MQLANTSVTADGVLCIAARDAYRGNFPEGDRVGEMSAESVPVHAGVLSAQGCESGIRKTAPAVRFVRRRRLHRSKPLPYASVFVAHKHLGFVEGPASYPP